MTIKEFEKGQKIYCELMNCTRALQELKQSCEIRFSILLSNGDSMHKADEEVKRMLIQHYEDKLAKLTKQFNEV